MNIFLGSLACKNLFSFNFPLREIFFCTSLTPPPPSLPISFLIVRPLPRAIGDVYRRGLFPFRKRSLPLFTVDATNDGDVNEMRTA